MHKKSRKETLNVNSGWVWIVGLWAFFFFTISQFICNVRLFDLAMENIHNKNNFKSPEV